MQTVAQRSHRPQHDRSLVTLILTAHDWDAYLAEAVKAGVGGFLTKEEKSNRLIDVIRRALLRGGLQSAYNPHRAAVGVPPHRFPQFPVNTSCQNILPNSYYGHLP
jgi:DNA-binding NarL/FixJ family response regulator